MSKRLRIPGHKLIRRWTGAEDGYASGRCECGQWHYRGWTHWMRHVISAHNGHLEDIKSNATATTRNTPEPLEQ